MISFLKGKIKSKTEEFIILDVNNVGYKVFLSSATLKKIGQANDLVELFTYLFLGENVMELYGFLSISEEEFFQSLIDVNGIGPKAAIKILSLASLDKIKQAIVSEDVAFLDSVPGIGRKKAERIVLDLKSKIALKEIPSSKLSLVQKEALEALVKLGYSTQKAKKALLEVSEKATEAKEIIKEALKILGR
jgi:Holliday junction DNA helicase RuvA